MLGLWSLYFPAGDSVQNNNYVIKVHCFRTTLFNVSGMLEEVLLQLS